MIALAPGGSASISEDSILKTNSETMRVLTEFLEIADDARRKDAPAPLPRWHRRSGRDSSPDCEPAVVDRDSAVLTQMPQLDPVTEFARERVFNAIRGQLGSWLDFFSSAEWFSASAARADRGQTLSW